MFQFHPFVVVQAHKTGKTDAKKNANANSSCSVKNTNYKELLVCFILRLILDIAEGNFFY